jgi:hypothetical protein
VLDSVVYSELGTTHLCLDIVGAGCDLLLVLVGDGGALKGGFEVSDVGHCRC